MHGAVNAILFRYGMGLTLMYVLYMMLNRFVVSSLVRKGRFSTSQCAFFSQLLLYVICLPVLWLMIRTVPTLPAARLNWGPSQFVIAFGALFFALPLMATIGLAEAKLWGQHPEDLQKTNQIRFESIFDFASTLIMAPFMEEFFVRTLLYNRLAGNNMMLFVLFSAFCFGTIHFITGKFMVVAGTFYGGIIFALVYAASGGIGLPFIFHASFNVCMVLIPECLQKTKRKKAARIYGVGLFALGITCFLLLIVKREEFLTSEMLAQLSIALKTVVSNAGTWILAIAMAIMYLYQRAKLYSLSDH